MLKLGMLLCWRLRIQKHLWVVVRQSMGGGGVLRVVAHVA